MYGVIKLAPGLARFVMQVGTAQFPKLARWQLMCDGLSLLACRPIEAADLANHLALISGLTRSRGGCTVEADPSSLSCSHERYTHGHGRAEVYAEFLMRSLAED